jgi:cytochrome c-type biogenesis protein CcmH
MTWVMVILVALAAFGFAVVALRVPRIGWTTFAAALALGLAGYALQASPGLPGAPAAAAKAPDQIDWAFVDERREMVAESQRSRNPRMIVADALARQGQYGNAAALLRAAVTDNPADGDAWLALGNALVEHADGALTRPALLAYRQAEAVAPGTVGPGYFLGLALIRQGRIMEARGAWQATLDDAATDAAGRAALAERLGRLDELIRAQGAVPPPDGASR